MGNRTRIREVEASSKRFNPDTYQPPVIRRTKADAPEVVEVEEVLLFSVVEDGPVDSDGRPTEQIRDFYVPKSVPRAFTLQATEIQATRGDAAANVFVLHTVLGEEGYEFLLNDKAVDDELFDSIVDAAGQIVFGTPGKSGSRNARVRSVG